MFGRAQKKEMFNCWKNLGRADLKTEQISNLIPNIIFGRCRKSKSNNFWKNLGRTNLKSHIKYSFWNSVERANHIIFGRV